VLRLPPGTLNLRGPTRLRRLCLLLAALVLLPLPFLRAEDPPEANIVLPAKKHQELLNEIQQLRDEVARLKSQPKADRPSIPTACRLTGQVDRDVVQLKVAFEFRTEKARELVALGCSQGRLTAAALDGQLPLLQQGSDGFVVRVETPGEHKLTLELELALTARGADRGFDLDLPATLVTTLDVQLPRDAQGVRLGGKPVVEPLQLEAGRLTGPLGTGGHLEVLWKGPAQKIPGAALLESQAQINVHVTETQLITHADLTLKVTRGETAEWRLRAPADAEVRLQAPDDRLQTIEAPNLKDKYPIWIIRLKQPSAAPVQVVVHLAQARPSKMPSSPLSVGPIAVFRAAHQRGTLLIHKPDGLSLGYQLRGEPLFLITPRAVTEDELTRGAAAAFDFSAWTLLEKPNQQVPPFLDVVVEAAQGQVEARVSHDLRYLRSEHAWKLITRIDAKPVRTTGARRVTLLLPADFRFDPERGPRPLGTRLELIDPANRVAVLTLPERQLQEFQITLEGVYRLPRPNPDEDAPPSKASLELPRPQPAQDLGGKILVSVPRDVELLSPRPGDPTWQNLLPGRHEYGWSFEQSPDRIDLAWRSFRPELAVEAEVDVLLVGQQAHVEHRLWFPSPPAPEQLAFRVPEAIADRFQVVEHGELLPADVRNAPTRLVLVRGSVDRKNPLALRYFFPLPDAVPGPRGADAAPLAIPLAVPEPASGETTVRVWSDTGPLPTLAGGPWEVQPTTRTERGSLPSLVVRSLRPDAPLSLGWGPSASLVTLVIERALIRVTVDEDGFQSYRASLRVSQLHARTLDVEFPMPLAQLNLRVLLADREVKVEAVEDGRVARLHLAPGLVREPAVLDFYYRLAPARTGRLGALQTTLHPPLPRGSSGWVPVRWSVGLPARWLPVYQQGGFLPEQTWGLRGWLLALQPERTGADLERWFASGLPNSDGSSTEGPSEAVLVVGASALQTIRLVHAPQQAWLLVCSLGVLVAGLGLFVLALPRGLFWPLLAGLGVVVAVAGLVWPDVLGAVAYGIQPGLLVLLLVLGVQWLVQQRYRRQLVFMPGFKRVKAGSSLLRSGSSNRPRGEPSTVDEPPQVASGSQWSAVGDSAVGRQPRADDGIP
jgi:hypothetical protein